MIYRRGLRPFLFLQDAERAHERTLHLLERAEDLPLLPPKRPFTRQKLTVDIAGITFPNPVGLAAGCDKNGRAVLMWHRFGFGFLEVGTVTADPQPGNPLPRIFRYPQQGAIVNRLGFNSEGSEAVAKRLAELRLKHPHLPIPLGINIGKNKIATVPEAVLENYKTSFRRLSRLADFMVINVSSPNTPGLRQWQEKDHLNALLQTLSTEAASLARKRNDAPVPLFLKISPDMNEADMDDVMEVALETKLAGIIATNTTIAREEAYQHMEAQGGLSGKPIKERSTKVLRYLFRHLKGRLPLIGVGGIATAEDAYERIKAGASLVQLYTALIYEGPNLPRKINEGLLKLMERDGVEHITDLIGVDA